MISQSYSAVKFWLIKTVGAKNLQEKEKGGEKGELEVQL